MGTLTFRPVALAAALALLLGGVVVGALKYRDLSARTHRAEVQLTATETSLESVQATLATVIAAARGSDYASSTEVADLADRIDTLEADVQDIEVGPNLSLDVASLQASIRRLQDCQRNLLTALSLGRDPRYIFC